MERGWNTTSMTPRGRSAGPMPSTCLRVWSRASGFFAERLAIASGRPPWFPEEDVSGGQETLRYLGTRIAASVLGILAFGCWRSTSPFSERTNRAVKSLMEVVLNESEGKRVRQDAIEAGMSARS